MQSLDSIFLFLIVIVVFWAIVLLFEKIFKLRERGWDVEPGLLLTKTTKFNNFLDRVARKAPRIWKWIWNVGIVMGFIGMMFIVGYLFVNLFSLFSPQSSEANAVVPLIPGLTIGFETFLRFLIPIVIIMITHEVAHGVAARCEGIRVKSSGILVFLFLFGAFVEPDERQATLAKRKSRMRFVAAGSFANIIVGFVCFVLLMNSTFLLSPFYAQTPSGVTLQQVDAVGPCGGFLYPGSVINSMNRTIMNDYTDLSFYLNESRPYDNVTISATVFPFIPSSKTVTLGKRTIETYRNNSNTDLNSTFVDFNNKSIINSPQELSQNDGIFLNVTPNVTNNYTKIDFTIDFINAKIDPTTITNMTIFSNVFLNETSNITLANYSIHNISGDPVSYEGFNTNDTSNSIQIFLDKDNVSDFIITDNLTLKFSFEVNSSFSNYSLIIDNVNYNINYTGYYIGLMGISGAQNYYAPTGPLGFLVALFSPLFRSALIEVLAWTFMLSIAIALFNLMPLPPFDGNVMFIDLVDGILKTPEKTQEDLEEEERARKDPNKPKFKLGREHLTKRNIIIWSVRIFTLIVFILSVSVSIFMMFTGQFDLTAFLP